MSKALLILIAILMSAETRWAQASECDVSSIPFRQAAQAQSLNQDNGPTAVVIDTTIRFEGLKTISETDLRKLFREQRVGISKDSAISQGKIKKAVSVLREYFAAFGYLNATIAVHRDEADADTKSVTFVIDEGERARISEVQFTGNKKFTHRQLLAPMKQDCLPPDAAYNAELFETCLSRATFRMRSEGYFQAKLGEPKKEQVGNNLKLIVPVEEGALYRIGRVEIEYVTVFSPEQVIEIAGLKTGEIVNGEAIGKGLQKTLRRLYADRGYVQYEYEVDPSYGPILDGESEGTIDFKINIFEGQPFKVRKIEFRGESAQASEELRRAMLIREGDIYSEQLLQESLNNINQLGLFEDVDVCGRGDTNCSRDVEVYTNDKRSELDVIIKVTRKEF